MRARQRLHTRTRSDLVLTPPDRFTRAGMNPSAESAWAEPQLLFTLRQHKYEVSCVRFIDLNTDSDGGVLSSSLISDSLDDSLRSGGSRLYSGQQHHHPSMHLLKEEEYDDEKAMGLEVTLPGGSTLGMSMKRRRKDGRSSTIESSVDFFTSSTTAMGDASAVREGSRFSTSSKRSFELRLLEDWKRHGTMLCSGDFMGNVWLWSLNTRRPLQAIPRYWDRSSDWGTSTVGSGSGSSAMAQHVEYASHRLLTQYRSPMRGRIYAWDLAKISDSSKPVSSLHTESSTFCRFAVVDESDSPSLTDFADCVAASGKRAALVAASRDRMLSDSLLLAELDESEEMFPDLMEMPPERKRPTSGLGAALMRAGLTKSDGSAVKPLVRKSSVEQMKSRLSRKTTFERLCGDLKLVCTGRNRQELNVWDVKNECIVHSIDLDNIRVDLNHGGQKITQDAGAKHLSGLHYKLRRGMITSVKAWSTTGHGIVIVIGSEAGTLDFYDTRSCSIFDSLQFRDGSEDPTLLSSSKKGLSKVTVSGGDGEINPMTDFVFDKTKQMGVAIDSGQCVHRFGLPKWTHYACPTLDHLLSDGSLELQIEEVVRCRLYQNCQMNNRVRVKSTKSGSNCVAISPDQSMYAIGGWDSRIRLFDWDSDDFLYSLSEVHTDAVTDLNFLNRSVLGRQVLTAASRDTNICLYSL